MSKDAGIILSMRPANGIRRYNVTSSLIVWSHTPNYLWGCTASRNTFIYLFDHTFYENDTRNKRRCHVLVNQISRECRAAMFEFWDKSGIFINLDQWDRVIRLVVCVSYTDSSTLWYIAGVYTLHHFFKWYVKKLAMTEHVFWQQNNYMSKDHFAYAPSQWETSSQCYIVSHWLCEYTVWSLYKLYIFAAQIQEKSMLPQYDLLVLVM